jgi:tRNA-dihydrouridine synthase B
MSERSLGDPWLLGGVRVPNRVLLAPLAGIGNWFVRLQAKRYGAGMAVSEMVSSHAIHYRNRRTLEELLRIDPREREPGPPAPGGPISIQLFGPDPAIMRSAAAEVARAGADMIDLNMGCPVPKVCKTGAGAALLSDPDRAVAIARAARAGGGLPVTVKLRCGRTRGDHSGLELARRLATEGGVSAIALHPRSVAERHGGRPDYELVAQLVRELEVPVILTGGLREAGHVRAVFDATGAAAVMLARGSLGNPWLFRELLEGAGGEPTTDEILAELHWVIDRAVEHLGEQRASRYLRKFYPWYVTRLGIERQLAASLQATLQGEDDLARVRERFDAACAPQPLAA